MSIPDIIVASFKGYGFFRYFSGFLLNFVDYFTHFWLKDWLVGVFTSIVNRRSVTLNQFASNTNYG